MDNDDAPVGRVLTRREVIALLGAAGAVAIIGCADDDLLPATTTASAGNSSVGTATSIATAAATAAGAQPTSTGAAAAVPQCIVRPEQTEGPYFVDEGINRSDIRSDPASGQVREGVVLNLAFNVSSISGSACTALTGAMVDVWQCDALGVYSDVRDNMAGNFNSVGQKFLRGFQVTDGAGLARFVTVYPGWYQGRTVHIHFKIRTRDATGRALEFTSQLFFDDAFSDQVFSQGAYASKGKADVRNARDGIYQQSQGMTLLNVVKDGDGYRTTFEIAVKTT
jgi:protocatechuate 3,4-dioxygenase beta subunit